jgi:hypothetical protein
MAYITSEIETGVRSYGHYTMRGLQRNLRPIVCSFTETEIYHIDARTWGSGPALPEVPRDGGTQRTRADVPNNYDAHHSAIRPMTLARVVTAMWFKMLDAEAEAKHYLDLWERLTAMEKLVEQGVEPKLLGE